MEELLKKCKCGVYLSVNEHRDVYETVEQAINEINDWHKRANGHHTDYQPEINDELKQQMIKENSIYKLQFYPDTPVGFYTVYGTNLKEVIEEALSCFD